MSDNLCSLPILLPFANRRPECINFKINFSTHFDLTSPRSTLVYIASFIPLFGINSPLPDLNFIYSYTSQLNPHCIFISPSVVLSKFITTKSFNILISQLCHFFLSHSIQLPHLLSLHKIYI